MATFGIYQVLDPLYVTPRGSLCSGKIVGGEAEGRIAVKIFNPPKPDPDEPNWEPKYFLDRAQVQRRVAAAGGAHWAPVYSMGFTPEGGAYYVTDYHALTAQKMIDGRVALDATALHAIVSSVLAGLEEMRRIAGRAHANLKPSNVLLIGKGPADELRAVLGDPGQEYKAEKDGEAGDLHSVGALIHGLVLHRLPNANEIPVAGDAAWERLGDKAEPWRQLCAELLSHPIPQRVATLAGAAKAVEALAPARLRVPSLRLPGRANGKRAAPAKAKPKKAVKRPRAPRAPSKFKRRVVQLLAVLLLVGGGLGILSMLEASAREEVCAAREGWFGSLAAGLAEPQRRERFAADPHLRRVVETVAEVENANIPCDNGRPRLLGFLHLQRARATADAIKRVEQDLAPESWSQLAKLRELARTFDKRGWQQPAGFVAQLLEGVRPVPTVSSALTRPSVVPDPTLAASGSLTQRIERMLRLRPIIEEQAGELEPQWQKLEQQTEVLEASTDPVVRGFGGLLRREATGALHLSDEGFEGLTQVEQSAGLAAQVAEQVKATSTAQLDAARFTQEVIARMNVADLSTADLRRWLDQRPLYFVKREQIAQAAAELQKSYGETRDEVVKSAPEPSEAAAFELEQKDVEAALREFRQTPFIERDIAEGRFKEKVAQVSAQIANLKRYYHAEDAADWLKNLAGVATTSPRLKSFWDTWVNALRGELDTMAKDRALFARSKSVTDKLRDALTELEITIPQPPAELSEAFARVAKQRREQRLDELVNALDLKDPVLKPDTLKQTAESLSAWFDNLKALNGDFPIEKKLLTLDDRPDARWREKKDFFEDPLVQQLIGKDVRRIDTLQRLKKASRKDLVAAASVVGAHKEMVVAAWQQLGENRVQPEWPATPEELEFEAGLRRQVAAAIEPLEPAERKPLEEQLAGEGPRRWRRFVEHAEAEAMIAAAIKQGDSFRVTSFVLAEMGAPARYNVWLYLANLAIRDNNAAGLNKVIENLRIAANELQDQRKEARDVLAKLAKLDIPDPFADRDLQAVFRLPIPGTTEQIEFRRVEPKDGSRPFYLGTREVTLGQFASVIDGMKIWDEAHRLAWPYRPGKGDGRRGARVWEWVDPSSPRLAATQYWMTTDQVNKHNDFPREFHPENKFNINVIDPKFGGMPSERHPMQYVTAHAALFYANALGCRLPTSAEWAAALAASGKSVDKGEWNLRDQSWEIFRAHATKQQISPEHWPDRGAFPGDPPTGTPVKTPGPGRPGNDGTLLLRPAPATANNDSFHDLVGNVAEYVCERPDEFARWENKQKADAVKNFLGDTPDTMFVIGGSALSAPDVPLDKPLPVTRTDKGFSDVGIRLAFTAPARNPAERLKYVLADQDYIWPRTASAATGVR